MLINISHIKWTHIWLLIAFHLANDILLENWANDESVIHLLVKHTIYLSINWIYFLYFNGIQTDTIFLVYHSHLSQSPELIIAGYLSLSKHTDLAESVIKLSLHYAPEEEAIIIFTEHRNHTKSIKVTSQHTDNW